MDRDNADQVRAGIIKSIKENSVYKGYGMARTWHGREVREHYGRISNLRENIPHFERWSFSIADGENEYLDHRARTCCWRQCRISAIRIATF